MVTQTKESVIPMREGPNASLKQSAAFLQVCQKTVINLIQLKQLKSVRIGRRRFVSWAELERLSKNGTK